MTTPTKPATPTTDPGLKKARVVIGSRIEYDSGAVSTLSTALKGGGTVACFGVPSAHKGGPAKGTIVDLAFIETYDDQGNVAARNYVGWQPADSFKIADLADAVIAPAQPKAAYTKPADYQRKAGKVVENDAPVLAMAGAAD